MSRPVSIAIVGAGLIGRRHAEAVAATRHGVALHSVVDPADAGKDLAAAMGVPWFPGLAGMLVAGRPDGVVLATPNALHVEQGLACVEAGLPALVEKPIAADGASGERLVAAAEAAGVPLLTGHHRRHAPLARRARQAIEAGDIGDIVAVDGTTWLYKPDDYFNVAWRRQASAGPILVNLIHDIDMLHYLCGPIMRVHAFASASRRRHAAEDAAVLALTFANGALGTLSVSDTIVAPWSWELTARDNPAYPPTGEAFMRIGGTAGALELPALRLWRNRDRRSWWEPIDATQLLFAQDDPLVLQARHFAAVIRGEEPPLCSGRDGLQALRVAEGARESAASGRTVEIRGAAA